MYITINDIKSEKRINLSYPIRSNKEVVVITMLSDNIQYEKAKPFTIMDKISNNIKLFPSKAYAGRELLSILEGMMELR